jgi:hypothetical protein
MARVVRDGWYRAENPVACYAGRANVVVATGTLAAQNVTDEVIKLVESPDEIPAQLGTVRG